MFDSHASDKALFGVEYTISKHGPGRTCLLVSLIPSIEYSPLQIAIISFKKITIKKMQSKKKRKIDKYSEKLLYKIKNKTLKNYHFKNNEKYVLEWDGIMWNVSGVSLKGMSLSIVKK